MKIYNNLKNKFTFVRTLWTLAGLTLFAAGLMAFLTPNEQLLEISRQIGFCMLFSGILNIVVYLNDHDPMKGAHWIIADGLTMTAMSLFPIFDRAVHPSLIPFFFGLLELFSGIIKIVESIELQEHKIYGWRWFSVIGIIELFSGISSMIEPVDNLIGIHNVVSIIMFLQSLGFVFKIFAYRHLKRQ